MSTLRNCTTGALVTDTLQIGLFLGLAIKLCFGNLMNPDLYEMRRNRRVFFSVTIGSISCLCYYIFAAPALTFGFSPDTQHMFSSIFWFQAANDFCLFVLLLERLIPVLPIRQHLTQRGESVLKIIIPCGLVAAQVTLASYISKFGWPTFPVTLEEFKVLNDISSFNVMIGLGCNVILTILFLRALLANREGSFFSIVMSNQREWAQFLFDFAVGLFLVFCRLVSYGTPTGMPLGLIFFTGMAYPIVILTTYKNYIFVTRHVAKEILQTGLSVNPKSANPSTTQAKTSAGASTGTR
ncbi:hypothetical protein BKA69DRAFT_1060342 [Paraphysoderma sedebokerense]|nr:hypothetical protein BKA69DRAFT_1060342 [Paraphysoderma sedebokerense]